MIAEVGLSGAGLLLAAAVLVLPGSARLRSSGLGVAHVRRHATSSLAAIAVVAVVVSTSLAVALVAAIVGGVVALALRRRRSGRRRRSEGAAMASALELLIGELRVGSHPARALAVAAEESDGLVGLSLHRVAARARLGADAAAGLLAMERDSAVPEYWRRLAVFWELAAQRGLPMSVLMQAAHQDIIDRQRFADRVRAALAGARATAVILAVLPVVGVLLGELIGAHPVRFLTGGGLGGILLVVGVGLAAAGLGWADRIIERLIA